MVINDGSTDGTLAALKRGLRPRGGRPRAARAPRHRAGARGLRRPLDDRPARDRQGERRQGRLAQRGHQRYARYPLFCAIDADTLLDADALRALVRPFQSSPSTVAGGGIVRIVNGCVRARTARIARSTRPRTRSPTCQIVEYLRAFLAGRAGWSRVNSC